MTDSDEDAGPDVQAAIDAAHGSTDDEEPADDPASGEDDDEEVVAVAALAATYLGPLLTAPERGPTASTLQERGIDPAIAEVLDGLIDYVLEVVGLDVGDNLGPAGKIAIGVSRGRSQAGGSQDAGDDQGDDVDADLSSLSPEAQRIIQGGGAGV